MFRNRPLKRRYLIIGVNVTQIALVFWRGAESASASPAGYHDGGMSGAAVGSPNRKFSRRCLDQRPGVAHAGEVHGEGAVLHDPPDPPLEGSTLIVVQQFGQVCWHFVREWGDV